MFSFMHNLWTDLNHSFPIYDKFLFLLGSIFTVAFKVTGDHVLLATSYIPDMVGLCTLGLLIPRAAMAWRELCCSKHKKVTCPECGSVNNLRSLLDEPKPGKS